MKMFMMLLNHRERGGGEKGEREGWSENERGRWIVSESGRWWRESMRGRDGGRA